MKLKFEQIIDADLQTVWTAFGNPENMDRWQRNFESYTHKSGEPGQPGAISELVFNEGDKKLFLKETITERRDPDFLAGSYESTYGSTVIVHHFEMINHSTTRWTSWCNFTFRGMMRLMTYFIAGSIRTRTREDMERFKLLVETDEASKSV
jgi:uncharacterized protein YndB with AHSA1/START domain